MKQIRGLLTGLALSLLASTAQAAVCGTSITWQNNPGGSPATQNFGGNLVSSLNYGCNVIVDPVTPTQALAIDANGRIGVNNFPSVFPLNATPSLANGNGVVLSTSAGVAVDATHGSYSNLLQGNAVLSISNPLFFEQADGSGNILGLTAHPVKIDPTGTTTQPVSGTVTANAGSGTFAVALPTSPAIASGSGVILEQGSTPAVLSATNGLYTNILQTNALLSSSNPLPTETTDAAGHILGVPATPLQVSLANTASNSTNVGVNAAAVGGQALGAATQWGTAPSGSTYVAPVNANVLNTTLAVTQSAGPWTTNLTQEGGTSLTAPALLNDAVTNPIPFYAAAFNLGYDSTAGSWVRQLTFHSNPGVTEVSDPLNAVGHPDYVAPGTGAVFSTNPGTAANWGVGATGSGVPANAQYTGVASSGNLVGLIQADKSVAINVSTATTTQLVALGAGAKIYVTSYDFTNGTSTADNVTLEYGTGTNCGTGTTTLTGAYATGPAPASAGISKGGGLGPVLVVPAGNALCILTSAAAQISGSVSYTQF